MLYAKRIGEVVVEYPYSLDKLRTDFPDTSFPQDVAQMGDLHLFGVFTVAETAAPVPTEAQRVDELTPVLIGDVWTQQWALRPATQAELDLAAQKLAAQQQAIADDAIRDTAKLDPTIQYLLKHTAAEIEAKVRADVGSLAAAKTFIAKLAVAVGVLARRELRE